MARNFNLLSIPLVDMVALAWFFAWWIGYTMFSHRHGERAPSLLSESSKRRREWMRRIVERDVRIMDTAILTNLSSSPTFFASTSIIIIGGLFALLGTTEKVSAVFSELPFAAKVSEQSWEIKIIVMIGIFVYAFFKFTWALRQFNFCSVMVGAAPPPPEPGESERPDGPTLKFARQQFIDSATMIVSYAGLNYNMGLRTYYFGIGSTTWFFNPYVFMVATVWVVTILYLREFHSKTLKALASQSG